MSKVLFSLQSPKTAADDVVVEREGRRMCLSAIQRATSTTPTELRDAFVAANPTYTHDDIHFRQVGDLVEVAMGKLPAGWVAAAIREVAI